MPKDFFYLCSGSWLPLSQPCRGLAAESMLKFLAASTIREVEFVTDDTYSRTVRLGDHTGWIKVSNTPKKCPES